jgi:hypothetical protein
MFSDLQAFSEISYFQYNYILLTSLETAINVTLHFTLNKDPDKFGIQWTVHRDIFL